MPDFSHPVTALFIGMTIAMIFIVIGIGIALVKIGKKSKK